MTRVAFLTHSAADSGAEQSLVNTLASWPRDGSEASVVFGDDGPVVRRAEALGVRVRVVPLDERSRNVRRADRSPIQLAVSLLELLRAGRRVARTLAADDVEVVVASSVKSLVYGLVASRRLGRTVVWSLHDRVSGDYFPAAVVPVLRYVVPRLVDGIVVNSLSTLDSIVPWRTPVVVGTPAVRLDPRAFTPPGDVLERVVILGRLSAWKGQDVFLRAFARVFAGTTTQALVVGGALFDEGDYEQSLHALVADLGIGHQVVFAGHLDDPWAALVDADVLVHASRIPEPFGQVVVQGLWARCAVVATRPGGPAEVVSDGVDGLLVPCGDEAALVGALERLRDDPILRRELADAGRRTAAHYGVESTAPHLARWLDDLHHGDVARGSVTASAVKAPR